VRVKETVRAAVHTLNNMAEDAREGIGMVGGPSRRVQGGEGKGQGKGDTLTPRDYLYYWSG
jgi:hypothetical protein